MSLAGRVERTGIARVEVEKTRSGSITRYIPVRGGSVEKANQHQVELAGAAIDRDAGTEQRSPNLIPSGMDLVNAQHPRRVAAL